MNIGENIKNFRIFRGIKQQELADQLKKSKSVISNWERNENSPDLDSCEALCKILCVTPNELFGWEQNKDYLAWKAKIEKNNERIDKLKSQIASMNKEIQAIEKEQNRLKGVDETPPSHFDLFEQFNAINNKED